jgi:hypothetical protein
LWASLSRLLKGDALVALNYSKMREEDLKLAPWNDPSVRWVCEEHPNEDQGHKVVKKGIKISLEEAEKWGSFFLEECGGAGVPDPKTHDSNGRPKHSQ